MATAYIVDAVRTAGGRRNGRLAGVHPVDLSAATLDALIERTGIDGAAVDDVVMGCVSQGGQQAGQVGRNAVLAAKRLPDSVPAVTIDRQCGSSQQAIQFAAQAVMSGVQDIVIAAGVESMTRVPMGSTAIFHMKEGLGNYKSPRLEEKYPGIMFSQFMGAEMIVKKHGFSKDQLDAFALSSHLKAIAATQANAFANEIVPIAIETADGPAMHTVDEGIRFEASLDGIRGVKLLTEGGALTAASSSQICDGAAGLMVVNERGLKALGVKPLARVHHLTVTGGDPVVMLETPVPATQLALKRAFRDASSPATCRAAAELAATGIVQLRGALSVATAVELREFIVKELEAAKSADAKQYAALRAAAAALSAELRQPAGDLLESQR
jgi:acetyl-CoA C-acetyltransferase